MRYPATRPTYPNDVFGRRHRKALNAAPFSSLPAEQEREHGAKQASTRLAPVAATQRRR
jgi:hypothetical protein